MFGRHVNEKGVYQVEKGTQKILVLTLKTMDEERIVISYTQKYAVLLKLEAIKKEEKQRVMDFICGAAYVFAVQIMEITKDIYLLAPKCIRLMDYDSLMDSGHEAAV